MMQKIRRMVVVSGLNLALLTIPTALLAQEIVVTGTVVDSTQGVLPGVTVTATHLDSGNTFVAVSAENGAYRVNAARPGRYRVVAELPGFASSARENIELLVGRTAAVDFTLQPSGVNESVTVTSEAPLVDTTASSVAGNVDTRQMEQLPLNGRNWMQLTLLVPGSRVNSVDDSPGGSQGGAAFQLNLDGQQVSQTQTTSAWGQPKFSRDAISEFEVVTNRFDATQGRSTGMQVNAVTRAGTNQFAGSLSGFFRDDKFNAADPVAKRVLPYSNQQVSATFGGPVRQNRAHFFGYYEGEREPQSLVFTSPYPSFNIDLVANNVTNKTWGGRFDRQLGQTTHLMVRGNVWNKFVPYEFGASAVPGSTLHPSVLSWRELDSAQVFGSVMRASGQSTYEFRGGFNGVHSQLAPYTPSPEISVRSYTIGTARWMPNTQHQNEPSVRFDYSRVAGNHQLKLGSDLQYPIYFYIIGHNIRGTINATGGPVPANLESLFPVWDDPSTWNLSALSPITLTYTKGFFQHGLEGWTRGRPQIGAWIQDDWRLSSRLTVNLGLRYDFALDAHGNEVTTPPLRPTKSPQEPYNFGPRVGFARTFDDDALVLRGGYGLYFAGANDLEQQSTTVANEAITLAAVNDGRSDFLANPFPGITTYNEALAAVQAGRFITSPTTNVGIAHPNFRTAYAHQATVGLQRQIGSVTAVQADYVFSGLRRERSSYNTNLTYDPATGVNYPFTDASHRPWPEFLIVTTAVSETRANYNALVLAVTKRYSANWQAGLTYTVSKAESCDPSPVDHAFPVPEDLGGACGPSLGTLSGITADQRNRVVLNGIWTAPGRVEVSGIYFFGSGPAAAHTYGGDLRRTGGSAGYSGLRPNGTIVLREDVIRLPALHRVDLRLQRSFRFGRMEATPLAEVFNVFNHDNFASIVGNEASAAFGQPVQSLSVAYAPRMLQLGFRLEF